MNENLELSLKLLTSLVEKWINEINPEHTLSPTEIKQQLIQKHSIELSMFFKGKLSEEKELDSLISNRTLVAARKLSMNANSQNRPGFFTVPTSSIITKSVFDSTDVAAKTAFRI